MSVTPELSGARLFAGLAVSDLDVAESWFEAFLGAPAFAPNETERVWTMSDQCHIYIELDPEGAGRSRVTLFVEDLPGFTARAARHRIYPALQESYGNGVLKTVYDDPDGNHIGVGGSPS